MKMRVVLFAVLALAIAFGTARLAISRLSAARQEMATENVEKQAPKAYVLVAAKDLPAGTLLHAEDVHWQSWPDEALNDAYLRKDRDDLDSISGAVVRLHIAKGEPLTAGRVIKLGERGFLAAVLAPGMRATSLMLTPMSDVGGLILPGDRVDLILSHQIKDDRAPNEPARQVSETVLTDLRVVAIDQTVNDQEKKPISGKTATFEVTSKQAEIIEVAKMLGNLSLVLRSAGNDRAGQPDDGQQLGTASQSRTWDSDVSPLIVHHDPGTHGPSEITVLRGGARSAPPAAAVAAPRATGGL